MKYIKYLFKRHNQVFQWEEENYMGELLVTSLNRTQPTNLWEKRGPALQGMVSTRSTLGVSTRTTSKKRERSQGQTPK